MKIYLSATAPTEQNKSHQWISNISALDSSVMTSQASLIICDNFFSMLPIEQIQSAVNIVVSKMRIGCELIILAPDAAILSQRITKGEIDLNTLNMILFKNGAVQSLYSMEFLESLLPPNLKIYNKHFDLHTSEIVIKARRFS
tara:strand:+ start:292 stop:720 length:429 start_codon:yes stop_codon:yes gene_type:complete